MIILKTLPILKSRWSMALASQQLLMKETVIKTIIIKKNWKFDVIPHLSFSQKKINIDFKLLMVFNKIRS